MLDLLCRAGKEVRAVGKIHDIFNGKGITSSVHTTGNMDGVDHTLEWMQDDFEGLIFTNLVDFDSKYGHRRNPEGYGQALMDFDARLPELFRRMRPDDVLMICADHGNDPTHTGFDHTREYIPFLAYGREIESTALPDRHTFADIGETICDMFHLPGTGKGESFLSLIRRRK